MDGFLCPGAPRDDVTKVTILEPSSGKPVFRTSHQMFADVLKLSDAVEAISFVIHSYSVSPFQPLDTVSLTKTSDCYYFKFIKARVPTVQTRLPFGLKNSPRKRKPRQQAAGQTAAGQSRVKRTRVEARAAAPADEGEDLEKDQDQAHLPSSDSHNSSSSDSSTSESMSESESAADNSQSGDESQVEEMVLDPKSKEEERQQQLVMRSHQKLMELRHGLFCPRGEPPASEAEAAAPPSRPPNPSSGSRGPTFCNSELGLVDAGVQVSGKLAQCRHCNSKIPKGSTRFAYSWKRQKFASWLHVSCTVPHLQQEKASIPQALAFLARMKEKEDLLPQVTEALGQVESALK